MLQAVTPLSLKYVDIDVFLAPSMKLHICPIQWRTWHSLEVLRPQSSANSSTIWGGWLPSNHHETTGNQYLQAPCKTNPTQNLVQKNWWPRIPSWFFSSLKPTGMPMAFQWRHMISECFRNECLELFQLFEPRLLCYGIWRLRSINAKSKTNWPSR